MEFYTNSLFFKVVYKIVFLNIIYTKSVLLIKTIYE
jgi:hypothetical protein